MNTLEDQLTEALRERASGITLDRDLLRPAVRRVRRRRQVRFSAVGVGVAAAVGLYGLAPSAPPPTLDVAFVTARVSAAMNDDDVVEQVSIKASLDGVTTPYGVWFDPETGSQRTADPSRDQERGAEVTSGRLVFTAVDHAARTWERSSFAQTPGDRPGPDVMGAPTPGEVRDLLSSGSGSWELVGPVTDSLHLRQASGEASSDVWVDATTYRPVRMVVVKEKRATVESAFTWLPRTPANLARVTVQVPPGYRHVHPAAEAP